MKRIGVLGGISAQATMDFEARVHEVAQRLVPQDWNAGYPPMVVWYHRQLPLRRGDDGRVLVPREIDPGLLEAAAWLGRVTDLLVMPCNAAHVGVRDLERAAGRPVLSMVDVTLAAVERRGWRRVGVLGFDGAPPLYLDPLRARGVACETIGADLQARLNAAIRAVMEGREGKDDAGAAREAVATLRAAGADGGVLGCTEIPLLVPEEREAPDLVDPVALLAEAAVRAALGAPMPGAPAAPAGGGPRTS
jgi:aspartate racemase